MNVCWAIALATVISFGATIGVARAEVGAVIVVGESSSTDRRTAGEAIQHALREGGWSSPRAALSDREQGAIARCVREPLPWSCVAKITGAKRVDQIAVVSVDPQRTGDGADMVVLTARLIVAGNDSVIPLQRFCSHCTSDVLTKLARELASEALERVALRGRQTALSVKTTPQGALAFLNGKPMGATDITIDIVPGTHTIRIERSGYHTVTRTVDAAKGTTSEVSETLRPDPSSPRVVVGTGESVDDIVSPTRAGAMPSRLAPAIAVGVGIAAAGSGIVLLVLDEDAVGPREVAKEEYTDTIVPGVALIAVGTVTAAIGGYLLRKYTRQMSRIAIVPTSGGAAVGFAGSF